MSIIPPNFKHSFICPFPVPVPVPDFGSGFWFRIPVPVFPIFHTPQISITKCKLRCQSTLLLLLRYYKIHYLFTPGVTNTH